MFFRLKDALLGFTSSFQHLDGRTVEVTRKEVTPPGLKAGFTIELIGFCFCCHRSEYVHTLAGEGMPVHNYPAEKGDLHVKYTVRFPKTLTAQQKDSIKQLLAA